MRCLWRTAALSPLSCDALWPAKDTKAARPLGCSAAGTLSGLDARSRWSRHEPRQIKRSLSAMRALAAPPPPPPPPRAAATAASRRMLRRLRLEEWRPCGSLLDLLLVTMQVPSQPQVSTTGGGRRAPPPAAALPARGGAAHSPAGSTALLPYVPAVVYAACMCLGRSGRGAASSACPLLCRRPTCRGPDLL